MKIFRFLSYALLGTLASAQAVVLNADNPTMQLSGNGLWQVEAVKNATSIAGTAITMGALICEIPEEKPAMNPGMDY